MENFTTLFLVFLMSLSTTAADLKHVETHPVCPTPGAFSKTLQSKPEVFVDKTMLIKEVITSTVDVILFTYPRRWGKSMNMDMLRTFLQIQVDAYGKRYATKSNTTNYRLFMNKKPKLLISNEQHVMEHLGEFPVIFLDFATLKGSNWRLVFEQLKVELHNSFLHHEYLLESTKLRPRDKDLFNDYIDKHKCRKLDAVEIKDSLKFLSRLLFTHFNKKVYILIDEYDTAFNNFFKFNEFTVNDLHVASEFFNLFYENSMKLNAHLKKGILTGILRIAKTCGLSSLNNVDEVSFLDRKFTPFYGFYRNEVEQLYRKNNFSNDMLRKADKWYDGYAWSASRIKTYNPWSITRSIIWDEIKKYWVQSGPEPFMLRFLKFTIIRDLIRRLLNKQSVEIAAYSLRLRIEDIIDLKKLLSGSEKCEIGLKEVNLLFTYFLALGYFTPEQFNEDTEHEILNIQIPNLEIRSTLEQELISYYEQIFNVHKHEFTDAGKELGNICCIEEKPTENLKAELEILFKKFPPFTNIKNANASKGVHGNEDVIHSIIIVVVSNLRHIENFTSGSEIWCERETKKGRADIVLMKETILLGIIIEIKYEGNSTRAVAQAQHYTNVFKPFTSIKHIRFIGISVNEQKIVDISTKLGRNPAYT